MRGHQSRPFFPAFFSFDKWILRSSCFAPPTFVSHRIVNAVTFENVQFYLSGLFLHCRGNRNNPHITKKRNKKEDRMCGSHFFRSQIDIHSSYKRQSIFTSKIVKGFCQISDFLGLIFLIAYISSRIVGKPKVG